MAFANFKHVKISSLLGVVPQKCINIDDEIQYYKNDKKLLERNKKILGLGTRYVIEEGTTVSDLLESAALKLIEKEKIDKDKIEALLIVSSSHDYRSPATACILQNRLGLQESCLCYDLSGLACSAYVHGLINAHALIESGAVKNCLLLCGDLASTHSNIKNRKVNMLFSDIGTATFLEYSKEETDSYFYMGTRGEGWDKLVTPASGKALPIRQDILDIEIINSDNDVWHLYESLMKGMDVFRFTMDIGPKCISRLLEYSGKTIDDIDFFALHQANGQIVKNVASYAKLPKDKYSMETFTRYANCASASVVSVLLDKCADKNIVFLCTFGVGFSFGNAIINFSDTRNYGFEQYKPLRKKMTRQEQIDYWIKYYKGE